LVFPRTMFLTNLLSNFLSSRIRLGDHDSRRICAIGELQPDRCLSVSRMQRNKSQRAIL